MTTPAELKIRRERLGLTQGQLAAYFGVQDRAVRRWEAGDSPIPSALDSLLTEISDYTTEFVASRVREVERLVAEATERLDADTGEVVVYVFATDEDLWEAHPGFKPLGASWHRMTMARISEALTVPIRFEFDPFSGD